MVIDLYEEIKKIIPNAEIKWVKTVDTVDLACENGYCFEGKFINGGTVNIRIPRHILVNYKINRLKYYQIYTLDASGLVDTDIVTDDRTKGWSVRIKYEVDELLSRNNHKRTQLLDISDNQLVEEIKRRGLILDHSKIKETYEVIEELKDED